MVAAALLAAPPGWIFLPQASEQRVVFAAACAASTPPYLSASTRTCAQGWDVPDRDSAAAAHPAPALPDERGSASSSAARLPEIALKSRDERERAEIELLGRARRIGDALEDAFCSEGRATRKPVRTARLRLLKPRSARRR